MNPHFETLQDVLALEVIQELVILSTKSQVQLGSA